MTAAISAYPGMSRARWSMIAVVLLGFLLSTDLTLTTLLIEPMKRDMQLTDVQIGLLQGTAFGLSFALCSIPSGLLIDRTSRKNILVCAVLIWIVSMAGTALAHSLVGLIVCRIGLGIVFALVIPASLSLIADLFPPERRSVATSMFAVGQATGQAFGILAGGLAFDFLTGSEREIFSLTPWRALYLMAALLAAGLLLPTLLLREPERQEQQPRGQHHGLRKLWPFRGFLLPLWGAMLFSQICFQAAVVWSAPILIRSHGLTPGEFAGWLSAITLLGGVVGALLGGQSAEWGRRRLGRPGVLVPGLVAALATAPLSLFALALNVPLFATLLALNLLMGAVVATIGAVAITLNIPNDVRGFAIGTNVFISAAFGAATAPVLIAHLGSVLGGDAWLGTAIAGVSLPSSLLAAVFFALAIRGSRLIARELPGA